DDEFQLFVSGVEVRRDANSGARPEIDDKLAMDQFLRDRSRVLVCNRDRATTLVCVFRTRHSESCFFGQIDQILRLSHALFANLLYPDLVYDLVTGLRSIERGNRGRAVQEAGDVWRVAQRRVEGKRRLMGHPARGLRFEFVLQVGSDVQVAGAWSTAEPFH